MNQFEYILWGCLCTAGDLLKCQMDQKEKEKEDIAMELYLFVKGDYLSTKAYIKSQVKVRAKVHQPQPSSFWPGTK